MLILLTTARIRLRIAARRTRVRRVATIQITIEVLIAALKALIDPTIAATVLASGFIWLKRRPRVATAATAVLMIIASRTHRCCRKIRRLRYRTPPRADSTSLREIKRDAFPL